MTYNASKGIENSIKNHFPNSYESKIKKYHKLGIREKITLNTSSDVFVRKEGCTIHDVKYLLNDKFTNGMHKEELRRLRDNIELISL